MAVGFLDRRAGFAQFSEARIRDPAALSLAAKIRFEINPKDEYPRNFTGHLKATLKDGSVREYRQPFMRGGAHAPLSTRDVEAKFFENALYGGWDRRLAERLLEISRDLFSASRLDVLEQFRM
jgi:2-methylcitrate dehydratase PrpD